MQMTKKEVCEEVVNLMREYFTGNSMPVSIGITDSGDIARWHNVHQNTMSNMVCCIVDTEGGWSFGDFDGDIEKDEDWDNNTDWLQQIFFDSWLDNSIDNCDDIEIEWGEDYPENY